MTIKTISTVVTPAASYDLIDLVTVKEELSITDNSKDGVLRRYIKGASAAAAQYCNRKFQVETVQDTMQRDRIFSPVFAGPDLLQLSRWPVVAFTSITENGVALTKDVDYLIDMARGQLVRLCGTRVSQWKIWPVVAQYSSGYDPIPDDVIDAAARMVTRRYASRGRDPNLKQQNIPGVIDQSWWIATGGEAGNLSPDIADVLDNYRVPVLM